MEGPKPSYQLNHHHTHYTNTHTDTTKCTSLDIISGTISGTITGTITASQWGTRPPPIAAIYIEERSYVFYFDSTDNISYLGGKDRHNFADTTVGVKDGEAKVKVESSKALLAATVYQDRKGNPVSIRVYYSTGTSNELKELVGEFDSDENDIINWKSGQFTDKKYKASPGSELTANSSKSGTPGETVLRVFFMSEENPEHISEAYCVDGEGWNLKILE